MMLEGMERGKGESAMPLMPRSCCGNVAVETCIVRRLTAEFLRSESSQSHVIVRRMQSKEWKRFGNLARKSNGKLTQHGHCT